MRHHVILVSSSLVLASVLLAAHAHAVAVDLTDLPQAARITVADFDENGSLEFAVLGRQGSLWSFVESGPLTYTRRGPLSAGVGGSDLVAADLQGDGDPDLLAVSGVQASIAYFRNSGGQFAAEGMYPLPALYSARSVAAVDVEGNGFIDILATGSRAGFSSGAITMWASLGTMGFSDGRLLLTPRPERIEVGLLDPDPWPDFVITCPDHDVLLVALQRMDISTNWGIAYSQQTSIAVPNPTWTAIADLDGDGDREVAVTSAETNGAYVLDNLGDGTFAAPVAIAAGERPGAIQSSDIDSDGDVDLAIALEGEHRIAVLRNNGHGRFRAAEHGTSLPGAPAGFAVADLDGDGLAEAIVALPELGRVAIRSLDGRTAFALGDEPVPVVAQPRGTHAPAPVAEQVRFEAAASSAGSARLELELSRSAWPQIAIFSAAGRRVRELDLGSLEAGRHEVRWDGRDSRDRIAPPGIYFARVEALGERRVGRLVWLGSER